MDDLNKRISNLTPKQRALLAARITKNKDTSKKSDISPTLPQVMSSPASRFDPFPLTDLQQAYWIGRSETFDLGNITTNAYVELASNNIDLQLFTNVLNFLIQRHDMLRMVVSEDGKQQILENVPKYAVKQYDFSHLEDENIEEELYNLFNEMRGLLNDSTQWPLFDIRVSKLKNNVFHIHFCIQLEVADAGSIVILLRELSQLYSNPETLLPPLNINFRDYFFGIEAIENTPEFEEAEQYWLKRIPTFPPAPDLPLATTPNTIKKPEFVRHQSVISSDKWQNIKSLAQGFGITPSGLLLSIYAEVLESWSGNPNFAINIPTFNRFPIHPEIGKVIGAFTSVILLEVNHNSDNPFVDRARAIQERLLMDLNHRYFDGLRVTRKLATQGNNNTAGYPVVFTSLLDHKFNEAFQALGKITRSINQTAQVWMDLHVDEVSENLIIKWDAVEALFPSDLVSDMLNAFCHILEKLNADESSWQHSGRMALSKAYIEKMDERNKTDKSIPIDLLQSLIFKQAEISPNQAAITNGGKQISYKQLQQYGYGLGRQLRELGAKPDQLIAIVMEKGWEQVISVVGVLTSGAAYLPIDPQLPQERVEKLLKDSQAKFVLTQNSVDSTIEWPSDIQPIIISEDFLSALDSTPLAPCQNVDNLAYVLYTSGSTGMPKGVMIEHRNVVNRMLDIIERFNITSDDKAIAITALHHDLSVVDIFVTLFSGGTIVVPEAEKSRDPAHWNELIINEKVTFWNSVPAFMEMLITHLEGKSTEALPEKLLNYVMLSGDWIPVSLPGRIRDKMKDVKVIGLGGPTETTVWDICNPDTIVPPDSKSIPYGKPMTNAKYYILNESFEPCPYWVTGEMYIGGAGVARGFWGDETKTKERFVQHPETDERLYKSGDVGRNLPNGMIEIIGRTDLQIKINGQRIELGEISSALNQHPTVKDCIVSIYEDDNNQKRLAAYIVQNDTKVNKSGLITDPVEKMEFKFKRHGLRHDCNDANKIELVHQEKVADHYLSRQNYRTFTKERISLESFSQFLNCLSEYTPKDAPFPKYIYPSAGGLYPVQLYIYIMQDQIEGVPGGAYYYHPRDEVLVELAKDAPITKEIYTRNNHTTFDESAFSLFLVANYDGITPMYGDYAREMCLLETGYMCQLLMTEAQNNSIGLCAVGSAKFEMAHEYFNLSDNHIFMHSLIGGSISKEQMEKFAYLGGPSSNDKNPAKKKSSYKEELINFLADKVPSQMVPHSYIVLDEMPLTPNGKVNRNDLPKPDSALNETKSFTAPRTQLEKSFAQVWSELLDVDNINIHDNFYDLGGHSLLSLQAISKIKEKTEISLSPKQFLLQTLYQMSSKYDTEQVDESDSQASTAPKESIEPLFFGAGEDKLYGCLHLPENANTNTAFILCNPIGQEYIRSHRTLRKLASMLYQEGYTTLRFDYFGCGDSPGSLEEASTERWLQDIDVAVDTMRAKSGIKNICLVGVRLGGAMAMLWNLKQEIKHPLILWDPVTNGKEYLKELELMHKSIYSSRDYFNTKSSNIKNSSSSETLGYALSQKLQDNLTDINLEEVQNISDIIYVIDSYNSITFKNQPVNHYKSNDPAMWIENPEMGLPFNTLKKLVDWAKEME